MPTFRVTIMLKPGVLDAPGQAIERGLQALAYEVDRARVGKIIELTLPEPMRSKLAEMCERFLANPLIETWKVDEVSLPEATAAGGPGARGTR
jgi:phosphoribosylformylglycinamidine synthase PurS subunit